MILGYEAAASSLAPATATAYEVLWAPTRPIAIREIGLSNSSAAQTLPQTQIIRASARGTQTTTVTPTAASNFQAFSTLLAATALIDTAWSVQPTLVTIPMRMIDVAGTVGSGVIWTWPSDGEIGVVNGNGLAIQNASGGTTAIVRNYFVWGE